MPQFPVTPGKAQELAARMARCGINEGDLEERFLKGSGPGGQKINKTASAVYLKHLPTGLEVRSQEARSQGLNRFYARRRLCELIEARQLGEASPEARKAARIRKQKARRRRRTRSSQDSPPEQGRGEGE